ncbi:hypothetical protein [Pseudomonas sp. R5-89-07]|uniref:hypothetical protein n=1 Tax=Pseudomonas sp. R5-89-07 TaxID=658644 RepID=UPI000F5782F3|nr:hypothetical protein [Pseudomonas sp. R5-89-07]AZF05632.1 hypothetical protein C4J94_2865 [Pseudomonas sp. R5-89-07]
MRSLNVLMLLLVFSTANAASDRPGPYDVYQYKSEKDAEFLDTMKACFIDGRPYSDGMIAVIDGRHFKCLRKVNSFGDRSGSQALEWVEEGKAP